MKYLTIPSKRLLVKISQFNHWLNMALMFKNNADADEIPDFMLFLVFTNA